MARRLIKERSACGQSRNLFRGRSVQHCKETRTRKRKKRRSGQCRISHTRRHTSSAARARSARSGTGGRARHVQSRVRCADLVATIPFCRSTTDGCSCVALRADTSRPVGRRAGAGRDSDSAATPVATVSPDIPRATALTGVATRTHEAGIAATYAAPSGLVLFSRCHGATVRSQVPRCGQQVPRCGHTCDGAVTATLDSAKRARASSRRFARTSRGLRSRHTHRRRGVLRRAGRTAPSERRRRREARRRSRSSCR